MLICEEPLFWINHAKDLFAKLVAQRDAIGVEFGFGAEGDDWPDRKADKLVISRPGELLDEARAQELVEWLVISGHTIARVLSKYL